MTTETKPKEKPSEEQLDTELADTFPASDPLSVTQPGTGIGAPRQDAAPASSVEPKFRRSPKPKASRA